MQIQPELGDGTELHRETEEGKKGVGVVTPFAFVGALQRDGFQLSVVAMQRFHAGDMEFDLAGVDQFAHLIDAVLRGAEAIAVMNEGQAFCDGREVQRPVERGVAAACDQNIAAANLLHLAHGVEDGRALVSLNARNGGTLRHEAAAARRDDDDRREKLLCRYR